MNIILTGHHVEITDALRAFTTEKLARIAKHFKNIISVNVILEVEKARQTAEATINIPNQQIHAHAEATDLYKAIDLLVDKLDKQVVKYKEKHLGHQQ